MGTNREKINKMTNEELAEFIDKASNDACSICSYSEIPCSHLTCIDGILKWLNQESEKE